MRKENTHTHTHTYIYIYVDHLKYFFQIAAFSNIQTIFRKCCYWKNILNGKCLYLYINFRSIVLFSDGKIADRQTNNSSKSLIQSKSLSRKFSISAADQTTKSVCVGCDKFLISKVFSFSTN